MIWLILLFDGKILYTVCCILFDILLLDDGQKLHSVWHFVAHWTDNDWWVHDWVLTLLQHIPVSCWACVVDFSPLWLAATMREEESEFSFWIYDTSRNSALSFPLSLCLFVSFFPFHFGLWLAWNMWSYKMTGQLALSKILMMWFSWTLEIE